MAAIRMVLLASLPTEFEARILAARLGADGIVWELRGTASMYPVGAVHLFVEAERLDEARLLLAAPVADELVGDRTGDDDGLPGFG